MDEGEDHGLAPARVRRQLESSLERLGVEHVQMYLTHDWDPDVPIAETLGVLDELVHEGKIGAFGASNVDGAQLREALAASHGTRYEWVQNSYSLLDREAEREVLPLCAEAQLGFTPFSPLAGGWLTGKYDRGAAAPAGLAHDACGRSRTPTSSRTTPSGAALDGLAAVASERGTSQAALALAWLLADPRVTAVIVGPRRPEHLEPALDALATPGHSGRARDTRASLRPLSRPFRAAEAAVVRFAATLDRRQ